MTVKLSKSNKRKHRDKETLFIILIQQRLFYKTKKLDKCIAIRKDIDSTFYWYCLMKNKELDLYTVIHNDWDKTFRFKPISTQLIVMETVSVKWDQNNHRG